MDNVELLVSGMRYGGWKTAKIKRSIEQLAGVFELTVTERWAGNDVARPIKSGSACSVLVDGKPIITGFVDDVDVDYDAQSHEISILGRDSTGDLVDCSAPSKSWKGQTLLQLATALCLPFKIPVIALTDTGGPFLSLKGNEGDTIFQILESAARLRGVLIMSDGIGGLVITRAGKTVVPTALVLGQNILKGSGHFTMAERFSEYTVKGQQQGGDLVSGDSASAVKGVSLDTGVGRHRPVVIVSEEQLDLSAAKQRADWEKAVRRGRSRNVTYTVQGWSHPAGIWTPNHLVNVVDKYTGYTGPKLISAVALTLDEKGTRAELTLTDSSAFEVLAIKESTGDSSL